MRKNVDFFLKKSSKLAYFWFLQVQISTEVGHIIYGLKGLTEPKSENSKANFHRYFFQLIGLNMLCTLFAGIDQIVLSNFMTTKVRDKK